MTNKKLFISIAIIVICLAIFVVLNFRFNKPEPSSSIVPSSDMDGFSEIAFDIASTIPGTDVSFAYPKNGFYAHGATSTYRIEERGPFLDGEEIRFDISPTETVFTNPGERTSLMIAHQEVDTKKITLEEAVQKVFYDDPSSLKVGVYKEVNGHRYFLTKISGDSYSIWSATALAKGGIVRIGYWFGNDTKLDINNESIFYQILSHVQFE